MFALSSKAFKRAAARAWKQGPTGILLLVLVLLLLGVMHALAGASQSAARVKRSSEIQVTISNVASAHREAEMAQLAYLASGDRRFLDTYDRVRSGSNAEFDRAVDLTREHASQRAHLAELKDLASKSYAQLDANVRAYDRGARNGELASLMLAGKRVDGAMSAVVDEMQHEEERLAIDCKERMVAHSRRALVLMTGASLAFASVVTVVLLQRQRIAQAESRRRKKTARSAALVNTTSLLLWTTDAEGRAVEDSPSWRWFTGQTYLEWLGWGGLDAIHPDDRSRARESWKHALETRGKYEVEYRLRRHDGEYVWTAARGAPVLDDGGRVMEWVGTNEDITERKRAEQERAELLSRIDAERASMRMLIDHLPGLAWTARPDGHVDFFNRSWFEYTGSTPADAEGWGWERDVDPAVLPKVLERWKRSIATGEPFEMEVRLRGRDGRLRTFLSRARPLRDASGGIVRWLGTATDVEELENLREKLHALIMQTPAGVFLIEGRDAHCTLANDAFCRLTGRPATPGRPLLEIFPELRGHPLAEAVFETYRSGKPRTLPEQETVLRGSDGRYERHYFTTSLVPMRDETGCVTGVIAVGFEVTDQVRARQSLEAAMRFAEQFVGILGHDLRSPLNAIVMGASLLKRRDLPAEDRKNVERILTSATRMTNMVAQLLDLTRSRLAGGIAIDAKPMTLNTVVDNVVDELRQGHPTREIRCSMSPDVRGEWDADRMGQVLSNLVGNAIHHADPARPIEVRLTAREREVVLEVRSFGQPIASELLTTLFDPYRRGNKRAGKSQGLGLGLFISQQIVVAHGGRIEVASTEAEGTRFVVVLPYCPKGATAGPS